MNKKKLNEFDLLLELLKKDFKIDFNNKKTHTLGKEITDIVTDNFNIEVSVKTFDRLIDSIRKEEKQLVIDDDSKAMQLLCALVLKKYGHINNISVQKGRGNNNEPKKIYVNEFRRIFNEQIGLHSNKIKIPTYFLNTNWFIYAKTEKAITVRELIIFDTSDTSDTSDENIAEYILNDKEVDDYKGNVRLDKTERYLVFNLNTKEEGHKSLHIKLKKGSGTKPELMLGQMNYIDHDSELWTLNIVALKQKECKTKTGIFNFNSNDIPIEIRNYLLKSEKTSLTIPKETITDLIRLNIYMVNKKNA